MGQTQYTAQKILYFGSMELKKKSLPQNVEFKKPFRKRLFFFNIVGTGENTGNKHSVIFQQSFLLVPLYKHITIFKAHCSGRLQMSI